MHRRIASKFQRDMHIGGANLFIKFTTHHKNFISIVHWTLQEVGERTMSYMYFPDENRKQLCLLTCLKSHI